MGSFLDGDKYTFYSFDLFYYGDSYRPYRPLSKQEWKNFVDKFLKQEPQIDEFSIIGYSLGGRFAIATALAFKEKVEQLFLIAPDGIFLSVWYKMATTPGLQLIFKYYILHPDKLEKLIKFNERLRIITKYIADFARKEMGSPENRKRVYLSWNYFKTLGYSKRSLYRKFQHASFERTLYLGSKDYVIIPNKILPFIQKMSKFESENHRR